jgi:hypothetical protein
LIPCHNSIAAKTTSATAQHRNNRMISEYPVANIFRMMFKVSPYFRFSRGLSLQFLAVEGALSHRNAPSTLVFTP